MTTAQQHKPAAARQRTYEEALRIERFVAALSQAMAVNHFSQRRLASAIGVESGTFTKYFQGRIDPLKVGTGIQSHLAEALGITADALIHFYDSGTYHSGVEHSAVAAWIQSEAEQSDLAEILAALQEAGKRWACSEVESPQREVPLTCPQEMIDALALQEGLLR